MGGYFPHIVSTIGMAICRPNEGTFMSITHKQGFDEVTCLKINLNKDWSVIDSYVG